MFGRQAWSSTLLHKPCFSDRALTVQPCFKACCVQQVDYDMKDAPALLVAFPSMLRVSVITAVAEA